MATWTWSITEGHSFARIFSPEPFTRSPTNFYMDVYSLYRESVWAF